MLSRQFSVLIRTKSENVPNLTEEWCIKEIIITIVIDSCWPAWLELHTVHFRHNILSSPWMGPFQKHQANTLHTSKLRYLLNSFESVTANKHP